MSDICELVKHDESGFNFSKTLSFGKFEQMELIDIGTRYKYLLVIYGVALYDSNKSLYSNITKDTYTNIYEKSSKGLVLQFYRNVSINTLMDTLKVSISLRNIESDEKISYYSISLQKMLEKIKEIKYKDIMHIIWEKGSIYFYHNNNLLGEIESDDFAQIIFKCYLDKHSPIADLRNKLLQTK